jgi:hypothetical protein
MTERVNARLKDDFGDRFIRIRSALKVKCQLMFIVALAVDQIIRSSTPGPPLPDSPRFPPPPGAGKFTSLRVFCKKLNFYDFFPFTVSWVETARVRRSAPEDPVLPGLR